MQQSTSADILDDATIASVFRTGLFLGFYAPTDLVAWADAQILSRAEVPGWIIDLSLGGHASTETIIRSLSDVSSTAHPSRVFGAIFGLLVITSKRIDFSRCRQLVATLHCMVSHAYGTNWNADVVRRLDSLDEEFNLFDLGYIIGPADRLMQEFQQLLREHALPQLSVDLPKFSKCDVAP